MRETRFKGICVEDNSWCFGFLYIDERTNKNWIVTSKNTLAEMHMDEVIPETVGQYIGVKGFGDELIFDGDKVRGRYYVQRSMNPNAEPEIIHFEGVVYFAEGCYFVKGDNGQCVFSFNYQDYEIEVIGNIHDQNK